MNGLINGHLVGVSNTADTTLCQGLFCWFDNPDKEANIFWWPIQFLFFPVYFMYYFGVFLLETVWPETVAWFSDLWKGFNSFLTFLVDLGILFYVFSFLIFLGVVALLFTVVFDIIAKALLAALILEIAFGFFTDTFALIDESSQETAKSIEIFFTDFDTWWTV